MECTVISSVACIVSTNNEEVGYTSSSFTSPHISYAQQDNDYQISAEDERETSTWKVNRVITNDNIPEHEKLINYALDGYDVASLSISVCNGPIHDMYQTRKQNLNKLFQTLESRLISKKEVKIEFAYICVHDENCYDLRKEKDRSNEYMLEKGTEGLMKPGNLKDIWNDALRGTKWPSILVMKFIDTNTVGRLALFDLLHPRFSPLLRSNEDKSYYHSFNTFINAVNAVTTKGDTGKLYLDNSVLLKEIGKYIIGRNKLFVFGYINDKMVTEIHWRETKSLLDLMQALNNKPVYMLPNSSTKEAIDNKHLKHRNSTLVKENQLLKSSIKNKEDTITSLNNTIQQQKDHFQHIQDIEIIQKEYLKYTIECLKSDYTAIEESREVNFENLKMKNKEIINLKKENNEYSDLIKDLQVQLDETSYKLNQVQKDLNNNLDRVQVKLSDKLERVTNELSLAKKHIDTLANENNALEKLNGYFKSELDEKREEKSKFMEYYEKELSERKRIENKLQHYMEKNNGMTNTNEIENLKREFEEKKRKIQEKAQQRVASLEPIMKEKDEKIKELLERLEDK